MDDARKIELTENILSSITALESVAVKIGTPSVIKALNKAKNTTGYALAQLTSERAKRLQKARDTESTNG